MQSRTFSLIAATAAALCLAAMPAGGQTLEQLAAAAAKKPPVIWYESSTPEQILKVTNAFNKHYPDIKVQFVRVTGGGGIAAKVIQESEAGAATASFILGDAEQSIPLNKRGLLVTRDWKALGIDPALVKTPFAVATTGSLAVLLWNKNRVKEDELPKTWDDFLADKWKGRVGEWVRAPMLAPLAKSWGEQRLREYVTKLVEMKPMVYPSTFQLAQQVAAGEVDIGMGLYHTVQPLLKSGAPIGYRFLDPTPLAMLYGAVVSKGANPEGAQVLLAWLATPEGAKAYEDATGRGNPLIKETETAQRVGSHKLVEFTFDESPTLERLDAELTKMLMSAGKAR
ncbi:MAG TPA: extracellular solute-binding protein [Casimicrobiaceae bacterium]|nr:extracellular solute-binding protein [Casimicrobiaceae bacterium]